jgi:hypothetical protein
MLLLASAPDCYSSYVGSNPDISQKYKMGDISKGVANTLYKKVISSLHFRAATGKGIINIYNVVTFRISNRKNYCCPTRSLNQQQEKRNGITIQKYAILSPIITYGFLLKQINCNSPRKKLDKHY